MARINRVDCPQSQDWATVDVACEVNYCDLVGPRW